MIKNIDKFNVVRDVPHTKEDLINFENKIVKKWESGQIRAPVHLSDGNEEQLIEIFKRIPKKDWVISTWRSHYHALLKGIPEKWLHDSIINGQSIAICNIEHNFYSNAIVGSAIPIACGIAMSLKRKGENKRVWCFVGDMGFETGTFYEIYKYSRNNNIPLNFIIEDNGVSTYTPTDQAWGGKRDIPDDVMWYEYKSKYPHYGTGKWVYF